MEGINQHFDEAIDAIMDPGKHEREMEKIRKDPLMSAGIRGFERLKWNLEEGVEL